MHLMFLGAPGSGKGTQAKILEQILGAIQVSTGDILRKAIEEKSSLGLKAKEYMDSGLLVPDNLIVDLIRERFSQSDFSDKWIMDGFPRTLPQAEAFDSLLEALNKKLDFVIEVRTDRNLLLRRITGRRVCRSCQAPYHVEFKKPKVDGVCDFCGNTDIYQRADDQESVVANRLKVYEEQTAPLIDYYLKKGILKLVDGNASVNEVTASVVKIAEEISK